MNKKTLYIGLINYVLKFAEDNNHEIEYISNSFYASALNKTNLDSIDVANWIESLNISNNGKPIQLRDYQINSVYKALSEKRITIIALR